MKVMKKSEERLLLGADAIASDEHSAIFVHLTDSDKRNIANMSPQCDVYIAHPDGWNAKEVDLAGDRFKEAVSKPLCRECGLVFDGHYCDNCDTDYRDGTKAAETADPTDSLYSEDEIRSAFEELNIEKAGIAPEMSHIDDNELMRKMEHHRRLSGKVGHPCPECGADSDTECPCRPF